MAKAQPAPDRRIIAIAVSPKCYDEIQKLKADRTWTRWAVEMALLEHPDNETLKAELDSLPKKGKTETAAETEVPSADEAEKG